MSADIDKSMQFDIDKKNYSMSIGNSIRYIKTSHIHVQPTNHDRIAPHH
jgi:hypothetical protein